MVSIFVLLYANTIRISFVVSVIQSENVLGAKQKIKFYL